MKRYRYCIYFNIESKGDFRSVHESPEVDSLDEIYGLIKNIDKPKDSVSIYILQNRIRVQLCGHKDIDKYVLEIHDASKGVCYFKDFSKKEILGNLENILPEIIDNPTKNGFEVESF